MTEPDVKADNLGRTVSIYLPAKTIETISTMAASERRSVSAYIAMALEEHINNTPERTK